MTIPPPGTLIDDRALAEEAARRGYEAHPWYGSAREAGDPRHWRIGEQVRPWVVCRDESGAQALWEYRGIRRWVSDFEAMESGSFWSGAWSLGRPVVDLAALMDDS